MWPERPTSTLENTPRRLGQTCVCFVVVGVFFWCCLFLFLFLFFKDADNWIHVVVIQVSAVVPCARIPIVAAATPNSSWRATVRLLITELKLMNAALLVTPACAVSFVQAEGSGERRTRLNYQKKSSNWSIVSEVLDRKCVSFRKNLFLQ